MQELIKISEYAYNNVRVQNVACLIEEQNLKRIHNQMDGKKATGIDHITKEEYGRNLNQNIDILVKNMRNQRYKPQPTKRVYIDKVGSDKKRPLGISCYEDKLVETRVAEILNAVYEPKFYDVSFGFRPNKNCHQAIKQLRKCIQKGKTNYIVEADIRSFFDNMKHEWIIKFLEHDLADKRFIDIVRNMLEAGVMEEMQYHTKEFGSPQGNAASPIIANV